MFWSRKVYIPITIILHRESNRGFSCMGTRGILFISVKSMKRFLLFIISAVMIAAALLPTAAFADAERELIADRVLIYNPLPYDQKDNKLFTGTLPKQTEDEDPTGTVPFAPGLHQTGKDRSLAKKDPGMHDFWVCTDLINYTYDKITFRLAAQSEHCSVWTPAEEQDAVFAETQLQTIAEQFESVIYPSDTGHFGPFRDLGGDGKLNIVTYQMNSVSVCGFFDRYDLYSAEEIAVIDPDDAESYNCLPIINVNTRMAGSEAIILGTLAHEFQHLILQSAVLASPANADRLGNELSPGVWLNESFAMEAEELAYPDSVAEQGYIDAYGSSDKVAYGMSLMNFDATSSDVGAYGQSYLFAEYLKAQCGETAFHSILDHWRETEDATKLRESIAVSALLSAEQKASLDALCSFTETVEQKLGMREEQLLSKLGLAFRLAVLLQKESGLCSIGKEQPSVPVYSGSGRKIEGGGAILLECENGRFTVPMDADSGLIFIGLKNGEVTAAYTVPEPEEGSYVLAANFNGTWYAIPAKPAGEGCIQPMEIPAPQNGAYSAASVWGAIFKATKENGEYRFACSDAGGTYALARAGQNSDKLAVREEGTAFAWSRFADGADRLQADGSAGRAVLYGHLQHGFGYFPSGYFENASFAKLQIIRVYGNKKGDANLDGKITAADVALILRGLVGLSYLDTPMRLAADLDGDGEATAADAARIMRIVVQLEPEPEDSNIQ